MSGSASRAGRLPVLLLTGPTGAGKTDWAIRRAVNANTKQRYAMRRVVGK